MSCSSSVYRFLQDPNVTTTFKHKKKILLFDYTSLVQRYWITIKHSYRLQCNSKYFKIIGPSVQLKAFIGRFEITKINTIEYITQFTIRWMLKVNILIFNYIFKRCFLHIFKQCIRFYCWDFFLNLFRRKKNCNKKEKLYLELVLNKVFSEKANVF